MPDVSPVRTSRSTVFLHRAARALAAASLLATGCAQAPAADAHVELPTAPTDVAATPDGTLYVTSEAGDATYRMRDGEASEIPGPGPRPYGVAIAADGRPCVSHFTSEDPLTRQSAVSCRDGDAWTRLAAGVGQGINGLAAAEDGLWVAAWRASDVEQRSGLLARLEAGGVAREADLPERYPTFLARLPSGDLLVSAWREDAAGFRGGELLRIAPDGAAEPFGDDLERPAGVAVSEDGVWVADHAAGALVLLTFDGAERGRRDGLRAPLGVTLLEPDRVCIAESEGNRVTCLDRSAVPGASP